MSMKFQLLIIFKMPKIDYSCFKTLRWCIFILLINVVGIFICEQDKFHVELSMKLVFNLKTLSLLSPCSNSCSTKFWYPQLFMIEQLKFYFLQHQYFVKFAFNMVKKCMLNSVFFSFLTCHRTIICVVLQNLNYKIRLTRLKLPCFIPCHFKKC